MGTIEKATGLDCMTRSCSKLHWVEICLQCIENLAYHISVVHASCKQLKWFNLFSPSKVPQNWMLQLLLSQLIRSSTVPDQPIQHFDKTAKMEISSSNYTHTSIIMRIVCIPPTCRSLSGQRIPSYFLPVQKQLPSSFQLARLIVVPTLFGLDHPPN